MASTLNLQVRYRPLRIGWCIRDGNVEQLRKVLRLTHTLWGGRFNPVIPVDNFDLARQLVSVFRVDALYPASGDPQLKDFVRQFPYLPPPLFHEELFLDSDSSSGKAATLLSVYHPLRHLHERHIRNVAKPRFSFKLFDWEDGDPLGDVLLITFGGFPPKEEVGRDFGAFLEKPLAASRIHLSPDVTVHTPD